MYIIYIDSGNYERTRMGEMSDQNLKMPGLGMIIVPRFVKLGWPTFAELLRLKVVSIMFIGAPAAYCHLWRIKDSLTTKCTKRSI